MTFKLRIDRRRCHDPEYYARRKVLKAKAEPQTTAADREKMRAVHSCGH